MCLKPSELRKLEVEPEYFIDEVSNFLWQDRNGEHFHPSEMATNHLLNCLRMIFNATAPAWLRLPGKSRRLRWSARYRRAACIAILRALRGRMLTVQQAADILEMRARASTLWPNYSALLK